MTNAHHPEKLPLSEALVHWTDPRLVAAVRAEERRHTAYYLHDHYRLVKYRRQLCRDDELRAPSADAAWAGPPDMGELDSAWRVLERDLRIRIERGDFHLRGVRVAPTRERTQSVIESVWAADFKFDFHSGRLKVGESTYVAVTAIGGPAPEAVDSPVAAPSQGGRGQALPQITAETVRDLSDEEVLLLLEEHARRVVANDAYKALDFGITKVSFMPLILRKMKARAAAGELRDTMSAEAVALARWVQEKAPSHQTPTAGAIENSLRNEYRTLKA